MRPAAIGSSTTRGSALRDPNIEVTNHPPEVSPHSCRLHCDSLGTSPASLSRSWPNPSAASVPPLCITSTKGILCLRRSVQDSFALHRICCRGWLPKDEFVICGSVCTDLERVQATNLSRTNHRIAESSRVSQPITRSMKSLIHLICPSECSNRLVVTFEDGGRPASIMKM